MATVVFFSGVQLMVLGIIGEYIGRMVVEAKQRPLYLADAVMRKSDIRMIGRKSEGVSASG